MRIRFGAVAALAAVAALSAPLCAQQPAQSGDQSNAGGKAQPGKSKRVRADLTGFDLAPKKPGKDSKTQIGGGTRGAGTRPILYAPNRGKTYTTTPTFYWGYRDSSNSHEFKITFFHESKEIYHSTVKARSFTYPAGAPALKPGETYSWSVRVVGDLMVDPAEPVEFIVVSGSERKKTAAALKEITGDSNEAQVRRAEVLVDARLWYDAVATYSELIAKSPGDAMLYHSRAGIYDQLASTYVLADTDYDRYEQLSGQR